MTTLAAYAAFLTARWDEIEADARKAGGDRWNASTEETPDGENIYFTVERVDSARLGDFDDARAAAEHAARHDPAYALADLAAKRVILDDAHRAEQAAATMRAESFKASFHAMLVVVRTLAEPFRDHPDHPANQEA